MAANIYTAMCYWCLANTEELKCITFIANAPHQMLKSNVWACHQPLGFMYIVLSHNMLMFRLMDGFLEVQLFRTGLCIQFPFCHKDNDILLPVRA